MFNLNDIGNLYNPAYLGKNSNSYLWKEKQSNPNSLTQVEFVFKGGTISYIKSGLLKEMQDAFRKTETLNLRMICDGVLFLDRGEEHFLAILEVKSRFGDVKKKAISQIPASYIKTKSILNDFVSYNKTDYKEFGLIVSYPFIEPQIDSEDNYIVMDNKLKMIEDKYEKIMSKYNQSLKNSHSAILLGIDFGFDKLPQIKPELCFDKLIVKHYPVENHCTKVTINLDTIINTL